MGKMFKNYCMTLLLGLLVVALPGTVAASVDFVNQWPATPTIVSSSGTASAKFTPGLGNNRLMLVAVATEFAAATNPTITVNYGGQSVTATAVNATAGTSKIWLGYLNNTGINNGVTGGRILTVTSSGSPTAMYATVAVFNGVNQATPITGSNGALASGSTIAMTIPLTANAGLAGNTGLSVYLANWNGTTSTPAAGYTELRDYAGSLMNLAACYKVITGTANETPTSTGAAVAGAGAGISLNPVINLAALTTCGDCHGSPPVDGTRNSPAGAVVGSHEKHSGGTNIQYDYACSACHYNNTLNKHADGFKNITGSSLPGNAYTAAGGKKVPMSNSPTMGTCTNTYCHSTARSNRQYSAPTWGGAGTTCLSCHAGRSGAAGPQANSSAGFKLSSSHSQHLKYNGSTEINCNHCHGSVVTDAATLKNYSGIIYHANGTVNVVFKDLAYGTYTAFKANKTCVNVACHGGKSRGSWQNATINTDNTCVHCHGVAGTTPADTNRKKYAPGWNGTGTSTDQISVNTDIRVGGHFVHLSSVYMKQIKCNECHRVPATAFDGTHMTGPRYSSQSLTFAQASTATKNSVTPAFISGTAATAATCSTTFCHGSSMPKGDTGGTDKSPLWNANLTTGTPGAAECARCHGNPPLFGSSSSAHIGSAATFSCFGCHKNVTDGTGKIIDKSMHINGAVNIQVDTSATSSCHSCHGNPPQTLTYGRYSGLVKPKTLALGASPANVGAHLKHASKGLTCNACHNNYAAAVHPDSKIQIFFRISSATITGWNTTSPKAPFGTYSGNIPTGGTPVDTVSSTLVRGTANNTNNSCNTYCHGNWNGSNRNMNPRWTSSTAATTCGACHGATAVTPPLVGTHARHAGYSSALTARQGYSFGCIKCHPSRSTSDHIKGTVHVRYSTAVLGTSATYTKTGATLTTPAGSRLYATNKLAGDTPDGTCSNITCHSNARATGMGTTQYATTAQWGNTTRNCLSCHGGRNGATGAPARSTANFTLSTTHSQHLKYPAANINCQTCHSKVVTDAATLKSYTGVKRHTNGIRDVRFAAGLPYGSYTSYKSTEAGSAGNTKTCNNVSCHGGKSRGSWSATAQNNDNTCLHCHGSGTGAGTALRADRYNAAPGWAGTGISTDGNTVATDIRVGAHFVHLSSTYAKKMKCNECHTVPTGPFDGTHMATARYNSQTLTFSQASTATKNSVVPAFTAGTSAAAATCTTTFCHGSGMPKGDTSGTDKSPLWNTNLTTGTPGAAECARCHGNPPTAGTSAGVHSGVTATTGCAGCHGEVVNGSGYIINKALHMNGTVQAITACNGCHDYDTNGATWGLVKNQNYGGTVGIEGRGAHYKHIEYLKSRNTGVTLDPINDTYGGATFKVICGPCHTWNPTNHTTGTPGNPRSINLGADTTPTAYPNAFGGSNPLYNGLTGNNSSSVNPKSCSNIDCHYRTSPIWSTY